MNRLVPMAVVFASACGSSTDDRPATLEYITDTILAPTCAAAECHSAFKRAVGDQFDTVTATRASVVLNGLALFPGDMADPANSYLIRSLTVGEPSILSPGSGNVRMPYDAAMPDADVALIEAWIADGIKGAQCLPNAINQGCEVRTVTNGGKAVIEYDVVECVDGNIGAIVSTCPGTQTCQPLVANGVCQ